MRGAVVIPIDIAKQLMWRSATMIAVGGSLVYGFDMGRHFNRFLDIASSAQRAVAINLLATSFNDFSGMPTASVKA